MLGLGVERWSISQDEMIAVFNQSRIKLEFHEWGIDAECCGGVAEAHAAFVVWTVGKFCGRDGDQEAFEGAAGRNGTAPGATAVEGSKAVSLESIDLAELVPDGIRQIKGRTFEVPGCGGFLMSSNAENLTDYLGDNREAATFESAADLVDRVKFYLGNEEKQAAVAAAGHARTMAEHTYVHRLADVFEKVGMPSVDVEGVLSGRVFERSTEMVA